MDHLLFLSCFASVHCCLVVTRKERADLWFVIFIVILLHSNLSVVLDCIDS